MKIFFGVICICGCLTWMLMIIRASKKLGSFREGLISFWEFDWWAKWILFFTGPISLIVFLEKD